MALENYSNNSITESSDTTTDTTSILSQDSLPSNELLDFKPDASLDPKQFGFAQAEQFDLVPSEPDTSQTDDATRQLPESSSTAEVTFSSLARYGFADAQAFDFLNATSVTSQGDENTDRNDTDASSTGEEQEGLRTESLFDWIVSKAIRDRKNSTRQPTPKPGDRNSNPQPQNPPTGPGTGAPPPGRPPDAPPPLRPGVGQRPQHQAVPPRLPGAQPPVPGAQPPIGPQRPGDKPADPKGNERPKIVVVTESEYVGDAKKILKLDKSATAADVEKDVKLLISLMGFEKDESGPAPKEALERYAKLTGSKVEDIPSYKIRTGAQNILKELGPAAVKEIAKTVVQTDDAEIRRRARQVLDHSVTGSSECNQALQLSHNLDAVRLRDGRSPETEEFRAKTLEEPTPKVTEKDFARAKEVKKALDSAVEDLGKQAGDKPFERIYERLKEVNELTSLPEKVARQRIFAARHLNENGLHDDALQQLEWGLKDDMKTCDDHYAFHLVAVDALKQVSPETAKDWMKKAEKAGVDMKYLSVMGAPKFK